MIPIQTKIMADNFLLFIKDLWEWAWINGLMILLFAILWFGVITKFKEPKINTNESEDNI